MPETLPRALVVEDDPAWQQILSEILGDAGLIVDTASQVDGAVERIRGQAHRLAVLDLSLGGPDHLNQDGLRVAEAVRRFDPGCAIIFLTGFATVELAVQVMREMGALTCLRKEMFRRADLRKALEEALARPPAAPVQKITRSQRESARGRVEVGEYPRGLALVVEDDAGWRSLFSELLEEAGLRVRVSTSYVEAIGLLQRETVRLAVLDLSLASSLSGENLDGYRLLSGMQAAGVPVIVVSGFIDPQRIEQALAENLVFVSLEKQAFERKAFLQAVTHAIQTSVEVQALNRLTGREQDVLRLLARGMTNKEIARALTITPNTVKRHLKSLFAKLGVNTRAAASARAIELGMDSAKDRQA